MKQGLGAWAFVAFPLAVILLFSALPSAAIANAQKGAAKMTLTLTSSSFKHEGEIPSQYTVKIMNETDAQADSIDLIGTLIIKDGGKLTLTNAADAPAHPDSEITGEMQIEKGGELFIDNNLGIKGDDGKITGLDEGAGSWAEIKGQSSSIELRIYGLSAGAAPEDSLSVQGRMYLWVRLDNDAHVIANDDLLILYGDSKYGDDGFWKAEGSGTLWVYKVVTGNNDWELVDSASSKIQFSVACTGLGGDFTISKGTLDVDQNVTTTGILTFESVSGSRPRIEVKSVTAFTAGS